MIASIMVNSMAAYALARLNFKGRRLIVAVVVALIIIPFEAIAIPLLLLTNALPWIDGSIGWLDTLHVQIIPFIADPLAIFLFYQFFINVPKELEEAMFIDGANRFRIYWQLVVPLSRPVISTVAILKLLWMWGAYLWPKMVTRSPGTLPLTVAMQQFFGQYPRFWGNIMAFAAMMTIPLLILFLIFQKAFVQSISSTGLKG
jgi:multiple sugar transport system permease protein